MVAPTRVRPYIICLGAAPALAETFAPKLLLTASGDLLNNPATRVPTADRVATPTALIPPRNFRPVVKVDQNDTPAKAGVRKPIPVTTNTVATKTFKADSTTLPIDSPTLYILYWC